MLQAAVAHELDAAVLHSFDKAGFTIVDPENFGNSFIVHCKRKQKSGRECPGQWSWFGGLAGPTNVTWHKEMRDFQLLPQYEYCCEEWMVTNFSDSQGGEGGKTPQTTEDSAAEDIITPRILIVFGSETGNAEDAAQNLCRALILLKPTVKSLNYIAGLELVEAQRITPIIAICSSFNREEFPTNAHEFNEKNYPQTSFMVLKSQFLLLGLLCTPIFALREFIWSRKSREQGVSI